MAEKVKKLNLQRDYKKYLYYLDGEDNPPDIHLTGKQAAQYATQADVQRLLLTHLVPWGDKTRTLAEADAAYSGELLVARPLDVYDV